MRAILAAPLLLACSGGDAPDQETIAIASWNLKNFGPTKLNDQARIDVIVDILRQYELTAIQEIHRGIPMG